VLIAIVQDEVVGVAKTHFHSEPEGGAPAGHYLGGVIINPNFRRRGIGSALTRVRMEWIWSRSSTAYYFANEHNTASIRMHETLGFQPIGRFAQIGESQLTTGDRNWSCFKHASRGSLTGHPSLSCRSPAPPDPA
jgi:aminoglycoside 6'-N-acetyltransferase I